MNNRSTPTTRSTALHDAFQSRHVPHDIHPSLVDVRWRARRRHHRRNAALGRLPRRSPESARWPCWPAATPASRLACSAGEGDLSATPHHDAVHVDHHVPSAHHCTRQDDLEGDTPAAVAQGAGVSLDALDAANAGNPDTTRSSSVASSTSPSAATPVTTEYHRPRALRPVRPGIGVDVALHRPDGHRRVRPSGLPVVRAGATRAVRHHRAALDPAFPDSTVQVFDNSHHHRRSTRSPRSTSTSTTNVGTLPVDGASTTTSPSSHPPRRNPPDRRTAPWAIVHPRVESVPKPGPGPHMGVRCPECGRQDTLGWWAVPGEWRGPPPLVPPCRG